MTHTKDIGDAFKEEYYQSLYATGNPNGVDQGKYLEAITIPQIAEVDRDIPEGIITEEEVKIAIRALPMNKAPGPDGFTALFYKKY